MKDKYTRVLFLSSAVIFVLVIVFGFAGWNFWNSLTNWAGVNLTGEKFVGFTNYSKLFGDWVFWESFENTLVISSLFAVSTIGIGLLLAILLDMATRGSGIFQTIYFVPFGFSFVATAVMWRWALNPATGIVNTTLESIGLDALAQPWITSPTFSLYSVLFVYVWQFSGFAAVIFYAGIKRIPEIQLEAASVGGASEWSKYRRIIIPQLKGPLMTVIAIVLFYALRVFDLVYLITGGGPGRSSEVLATMLWKEMFNFNHWAIGTCIGWIMLVVAMAIAVPFLYLLLIRGE